MVSKKLGILAGGGAAPRQLIEMCQRSGRPFFVIALEGQADAALLSMQAPMVTLPLGAAARMKKAILEQGVGEIVMIGRVRRPSLLELKPDWLALKVVTKIGMHGLGDDGLLRAIGAAIEEECGVRMVGAHDLLDDMATPRGDLTVALPDESQWQDIRRGIAVARALGALDVGQAVIVQQGIVLGVEAIEGTDALIERAGGLRRAGPGGVLVKIAKPQQDSRFDLPAIGPDTVRMATQAGLAGIALESGRSLMINRAETIEAANAAKLFIHGLSADEGGAL